MVIKKRNSACNFADLQPGDVFAIPEQEGAHLVCFASGKSMPGCVTYNAVDLETGELKFFTGSFIVERVRAELNIG